MSLKKGFRPWAVGTARGVAEVAVLAALAALVQNLTTADVPASVESWVPFVLISVRSVEGWIDDRIDPTRNRALLKGGKAQ